MTLSETDMERLAFNQYLLKQAREQSRKRQPAASASVLTFHDAVELFFIHSGEYLDASKAGNSDVSFMSFFHIINQQLPENEKLSQKSGIKRLNEARKNLKHEGVRPQKSDIDSFRSAVQDFFTQNLPKVFGIELSEISLINLINEEDVREKLERAEDLVEKGMKKDAVEKIALAYDTAFFNYEQRVEDVQGYKPYNVASSELFMISEHNMGDEFGRGMEKFHRYVTNSISSIEQAIQILSLGIDYRDYSRFDSITPSVTHANSGDSHIYWPEENPNISLEEAEFCLEFVTEVAIELETGEPSTYS